jgi:hypothetical protein
MGAGASALTPEKQEAMLAQGLEFSTSQEGKENNEDFQRLASSLKKFARMRKVGVPLQHCLQAMEFRDNPLPKELIQQFQSWVTSKTNGIVTASDIEMAFNSDETKELVQVEEEKELYKGEDWGGNNKNDYINMIAHLDGFDREIYNLLCVKKLPAEEVKSVIDSWSNGKTRLQVEAAKNVWNDTYHSYQKMLKKQRRREEKAAKREALQYTEQQHNKK